MGMMMSVMMMVFLCMIMIVVMMFPVFMAVIMIMVFFPVIVMVMMFFLCVIVIMVMMPVFIGLFLFTVKDHSHVSSRYPRFLYRIGHVFGLRDPEGIEFSEHFLPVLKQLQQSSSEHIPCSSHPKIQI